MLLQRVESINEMVSIAKALVWFFGITTAVGKHTTQRTAKILSIRETVEACEIELASAYSP